MGNGPDGCDYSISKKVLKTKIGSWKGKRVVDLFNVVSSGSGEKMLKELIEQTRISIPGLMNGLEVKFHSRKGAQHIQLTISNNTGINRLRDEKKRSEIIRSFMDIVMVNPSSGT